MSNIQIKEFNGSSYNLYKPYGYYSDSSGNADTVDGKHASDFQGSTDLLDINCLNGYLNYKISLEPNWSQPYQYDYEREEYGYYYGNINELSIIGKTGEDIYNQVNRYDDGNIINITISFPAQQFPYMTNLELTENNILISSRVATYSNGIVSYNNLGQVFKVNSGIYVYQYLNGYRSLYRVDGQKLQKSGLISKRDYTITSNAMQTNKWLDDGKTGYAVSTNILNKIAF